MNTLVVNKDARVVEVENEYAFSVDVPSNNNVVISDIQNLIEEMKPAHLLATINLKNTLNTNLYFGGIVSTRYKTQIRPAAFKMPSIQQTKYYAGFISMRTKILIKTEV
ncbi:hypothetical protein [Sporosarcina sp. Te-1]|uniref:hypothetical protein n=1 Tax=Sporosarcina sp. Te-1 TaxID=2818390 RepID=UPI001A9FDF4E|nr:hypothetical protein [Sporosarcina sp. Te-1]QTD41396.1 hypothetical protein J3U78_00555 [Sporosarcina sp. Te-1]